MRNISLIAAIALMLIGCVVLSAASVFALVHDGSNSPAGGGFAAKHMRSQQSTSAEKAPDLAKSDSEYGWGPFRLTDW
jgi:hypothetical protein